MAEERSRTAAAVSLENCKPRRAAILKARKILAVVGESLDHSVSIFNTMLIPNGQ